MKAYITGISGTGKSTIAEELNKKGIYAIDIDSDKYKLCHWKNKKTQEITHFEYGIGLDFLKDNGWYCDIKKLKELINVSQDVYIFGMAENQNEFLDLFDKIFILQCNEKTFFERIDSRAVNDYGKDPSEKKHILNFYKDYEKDFINKGAISINVENPIKIVIEDILK